MANTPRHHKLFWGSSYDRGIDMLLIMWRDIRKEFPDATLDIAYGWELWDIAYKDNKERQVWKKQMELFMKEPGITHHGRVGQEELKNIRSQCGIWSYPTYFTEINCITALEAENDGLVPVTMGLAALKETAKTGILIKEEIQSPDGFDNYRSELLRLMGDKKEWKRLSNKCKKFARRYDWQKIGTEWQAEFMKPPVDGKITVFTPTIRDGFWNIMASNLATQTHSNFEWVVVDGQKESREKIAETYSKDYGIDIKYIHQGKTDRVYGLANANNLAIEAATGELFVFLQDFTLIPSTGLEELLNVSRKHPGDFIAPVDTLFSPKIKPNIENKEDWFDGSLDVVGGFLRKNVRIQERGVRLSEVITDFEANYGAVPTKTLRELGGFWEFFDDGMGYDDTEIVFRGEKLGYKIWIDDTNQCVCLDHRPTVGVHEQGVPRLRLRNTPRYLWMIDQMEKGNLPVRRDSDLDNKISLQYTIPEDVSDEESNQWVEENLKNIITSLGEIDYGN